MKKLLVLLLSTLLYINCTKEPIEPINQGDIYVTLDYKFPVKSGDIAPKSSSAYLTFYHKYIESKVLTPRTYYANLYDAENHVGTSIYGKWGESKLFVLPPGTYAIDGISWPVAYVSLGTPITLGVCGDTAYLAFHDTITITQTSTNLTLDAQYDCALLLLDTTEVVRTKLWVPMVDTANFIPYPYSKTVKSTMLKTEEFYHSFLFNGTLNGIGYDKVNLYLEVTTSRMEMIYPGPATPSYNPPPAHLENIGVSIPLSLYNMQAGKYYYFELTENAYTLTPMSN